MLEAAEATQLVVGLAGTGRRRRGRRTRAAPQAGRRGGARRPRLARSPSSPSPTPSATVDRLVTALLAAVRPPRRSAARDRRGGQLERRARDRDAAPGRLLRPGRHARRSRRRSGGSPSSSSRPTRPASPCSRRGSGSPPRPSPSLQAAAAGRDPDRVRRRPDPGDAPRGGLSYVRALQSGARAGTGTFPEPVDRARRRSSASTVVAPRDQAGGVDPVRRVVGVERRPGAGRAAGAWSRRPGCRAGRG